MVKVVHLQIFTESTGRAALRLHKKFLESGIDSSIITLRSAINDDEKTLQKGKKSRLIAWVDNKLHLFLNRKNVKELGFFSYPILGSDVSEMEAVKDAAFIYIHWALGGFLNLTNIEQLAALGKPVIFFMHDMWAITGGCHHSFTCTKYQSHCMDCPILPGHKEKDLSYVEFEKKRKLYAKYNNLYFVSPSKWLYNCAKESFLTKSKPIFHIPNIIDNNLYKSFDKKTAKEILNIDPSEIVVAFGAISIYSPYKGWPYLLEGLRILYREKDYKNMRVLIFGSGYKKEIADAIPFKTIFMGYLSDEYSTIMVYNAADVFIAPSLADNLPTTVLESLSCGTPVVGFDVGGIPDMIKHKENGYLAKYKDAKDISEGIKFCIEKNIKGFILPGFDPDCIVARHLQLFDHIQSEKNFKPKNSTETKSLQNKVMY